MNGFVLSFLRAMLKPLVIVAAIVVACASAYWATGWWSTPSDKPAGAVSANGVTASPAMPVVARDGVGQPLRTLPGSAVPGSRYQLQGVMAGTGVGGNGGLALIAVDVAPARSFRVGDAVDGELVLLGVSASTASLGLRHGPPEIVLEVTSGNSTTGSPQNAGSAYPDTGPSGGLLAAQAQADAQPPTTTADRTATRADPAMGTPLAMQSQSNAQHPGRRLRLQRHNLRP
jgi:hypothetical protein